MYSGHMVYDRAIMTDVKRDDGTDTGRYECVGVCVRESVLKVWPMNL